MHLFCRTDVRTLLISAISQRLVDIGDCEVGFLVRFFCLFGTVEHIILAGERLMSNMSQRFSEREFVARVARVTRAGRVTCKESLIGRWQKKKKEVNS